MREPLTAKRIWAARRTLRLQTARLLGAGAIVIWSLLGAIPAAAQTAEMAASTQAAAASSAEIPAVTTPDPATVRAVQWKLLARGYAPGRVDGEWGPRTRWAILAYQRDAGLTRDGRPSATLLRHLENAGPFIRRPGARSRPGGARTSGVVIAVQNALAQEGLYRGRLDGICGPQTVRAIRDFQAREGLKRSGRIDRALRRRLAARAAEIAPAHAPTRAAASAQTRTVDELPTPPLAQRHLRDRPGRAEDGA